MGAYPTQVEVEKWKSRKGEKWKVVRCRQEQLMQKRIILLVGTALLLVVMAMAMAMSATAQTTAATPRAYAPPRTRQGQPDLQGVWQVMNSAAWDIQDHSGQL